MKDETKLWLKYAGENLKSAKVLLKSCLFNPSLQNSQQTVEKAMKALLIENSILWKKTHDIYELTQLLEKNNLNVGISDSECDLLNSIYLPSKYPIGTALPDFDPNEDVCIEVINIAERVYETVTKSCF